MSSPLAWFGLPDDADERSIKRAYAQRLKGVRPDADPAGFQQLHDMYRAALAWAGQHGSTAPAGALVTGGPDAGEATGTEGGTEHRAATSLPTPGVPPVAPSPAPVAEAPLPHPPRAVSEPPPTTNEAPRPPLVASPPRPPQPAPHTRPPPPSQPPIATPRPAASSTSQALTSHFDMDVFMADFLDAAIHRDAQGLQGWLQHRQELWSLHVKHEAGRAILQRLFRDPPPIRMSCFETTLAFFDLDHALTGIDPLQLLKLREAMQERHALVQRVHPEVLPWGANRRQLDLSAFLAWFTGLAAEGDDERLAATLSIQPSMLSLEARQRVAPRLMERLLRECPPMPQECAGLLLGVFGLAPLLAQANHPPGEFVAQLHMRWLMLPKHIGKLTLQVKSPSERYGDTNRTRRQLRWLQQPFRWWWITLAALVPKQLYLLGLFAWRLSGGAPARLDQHFDHRLTRFCIATADHTRLSWPRLFVGGVRCVGLLLLSVLLNLWTIHADVFPGKGDTWLPLMAAGAVLGGWLYYLGFTALRLWLERPEEPVQPWPLLRMTLVPILVAAGLALAFAADQLVAAQAVLLTTAGLSFWRYRRRNHARQAGSTRVNIVVLLYLLGLGAWVVLRFPVVSASIALLFWVMDLTAQRKQLRFRYRPAVAVRPQAA